MKPGYYWVRCRESSEPEIAKLTKNSGWLFFGDAHKKMIPTRLYEIMERVEYEDIS